MFNKVYTIFDNGCAMQIQEQTARLIMTDNCEISDNTAEYGGGIYAQGISVAYFKNVILNNNKALYYGGGFYVQTGPSDGTLFENCVFSNNIAQNCCV